MSDNMSGADSVPVQEAARELARGVRLIDLREAHERAAGRATPAEAIAMAQLLAHPEHYLRSHAQRVLLICEKGVRSQQAAQQLREQGFSQVGSVAGGSQAWKQAGLEWSVDDDFYERYARHLGLMQVGVAGQRKLQQAHVAIVGAGGLGAPLSFYLAAAGVGKITLIDDDRVELSNLQRQIVHAQSRIGQAKVESAKQALLALNPDIEVVALDTRLSQNNAAALFADADVVVDGADNFATRHIVNATCHELRKPWVYGAVLQFDGQASVFDLRDPQAPCYRCLFPNAPDAAFAPNCAEAGVLGVVPGLIGLIQANETIKLILGIGDSLSGRILQLDALGMRFREVGLRRDPHCPQCGDGGMR